MVSITRACPEGHVEYVYSGQHELRADETYVRETAVPDDSDPQCIVCGAELTETVEGGADA